VRPEQVVGATGATASAGDPVLSGEVVATELLGSDVLVHVQLPAAAVDTAEVREIAADLDLPPALTGPLADGAGTVVIARLDVTELPRLGDGIGIRLDIARLHFFDLDSGKAIGRMPGPTAEVSRGAHSARAVGES
jgi:multiple sugar transport system ATP-binding protein